MVERGGGGLWLWLEKGGFQCLKEREKKGKIEIAQALFVLFFSSSFRLRYMRRHKNVAGYGRTSEICYIYILIERYLME